MLPHALECQSLDSEARFQFDMYVKLLPDFGWNFAILAGETPTIVYFHTVITSHEQYVRELFFILICFLSKYMHAFCLNSLYVDALSG